MPEKLQKNRTLVENVFDKVYDKYDLMNDIMSFGTHRLWKKKLIKLMNPSNFQSLIDVGCGTGDIGKIYSEATENRTKILSVDPNRNMIEKGKKRLKKYNNIEWKISPAEELNIEDETYDFYTISFGLRNTLDIEKSLSEAYRVLKKGGRFLCLEFSKIDNEILNTIYKQYSKILPRIGKIVVGDKNPYEYLVKTIDEFMSQEELINVLKDKNFINCEYINLNGGIVAIHSGWKI